MSRKLTIAEAEEEAAAMRKIRDELVKRGFTQPAPGATGTVRTPADRIAELEARVAALEGRIDAIRKTVPARSCACPPSNEDTCRAAMCPRRPWVVT